ncbi:hypothetical protein KUCAC02_031175 [Chaenocephalus aceratus]|uniref:Uncharacterized protein n=1 Tax=Chaenocephalus aceratus TaxID=36190 RepID=A0ACB9XM52_CHAAC|nr:hypothetical protein KUCAC02_031175 [Chaenocephalus aceratus]
MVDVLEVLANVSLAFQSNDLFIYDVDVKLCEARIKLEGLKHNRGDVYTAYMATCKDGKFDSKNNGHITSLKGTVASSQGQTEVQAEAAPKEVISDLLTENHPDVMDVLVLVYIMVTLSPSSAAVERGFSLMNLIKTSRKSQMTNETLGSLMRVSHITTTVAEFDPEPAIQKWKTSA